MHPTETLITWQCADYISWLVQNRSVNRLVISETFIMLPVNSYLARWQFLIQISDKLSPQQLVFLNLADGNFLSWQLVNYCRNRWQNSPCCLKKNILAADRSSVFELRYIFLNLNLNLWDNRKKDTDETCNSYPTQVDWHRHLTGL